MTTEVERAQDAQVEQELRERHDALVLEAARVGTKVRSLRARLRWAKTPEDADALRAAIVDCRSDLVAVVAQALHGVTEQEVNRWYQRAEDMGCAVPVYTTEQISDMLNLLLVPNAPLREELEERQGSWSQLARDAYPKLVEAEERTGRYFGSKNLSRADADKSTAWLKRKLGVMPSSPSKGSRTLMLFIEYEVAEAIARAAEIHPYEVGI